MLLSKLYQGLLGPTYSFHLSFKPSSFNDKSHSSHSSPPQSIAAAEASAVKANNIAIAGIVIAVLLAVVALIVAVVYGGETLCTTLIIKHATWPFHTCANVTQHCPTLR